MVERLQKEGVQGVGFTLVIEDIDNLPPIDEVKEHLGKVLESYLGGKFVSHSKIGDSSFTVVR